MDAAWLADWAGLALRWFHFMIGVAWIGASFYFVWLNNAVRPEKQPTAGVAGEVWSVHGGAFYQVRKYAGAPATLPEVLHWFKWEAYLTWITGVCLLTLLYWRNADTWMIDPAVADIGVWTARGVGVATLVVGWGVYDGLCRSPLRERSDVLAGVLGAFIGLVVFGLYQVLAPRAAWMHTGAMMGTWMAANVAMVIIPGQRAMVDAMVAGQPPPLERGKAGALRSLHNNYLTLPVLLVMVSGHFPFAWGHAHGWLVFLALAAVGALYRHHVNLEERDAAARWPLATSVALLVAVAVALRPAPVAVAAGGEAVSVARVQQVIAARCLSCHATEPFQAGIATPPKGVVLDSRELVLRERARIVQQVAAGIMPLGNVTGMTDEERALIAAWGASAP